jgi:hypothetical protein
MAKAKKDPNKADSESDDPVTTVKARQSIAALIRQIGALEQVNQEDVLDVFRDQFKSHLLKLMQQRTAELNGRH